MKAKIKISKLLCMALCVVLSMVLCPITAKAAGYGVYVNGVEITDSNKDDCLPEVSGAIQYDPDANTFKVLQSVYTTSETIITGNGTTIL